MALPTELDRTRATALVLAGGGATRFGADKTRAELSGRSVLEHTLDAVGDVAAHVVVIGPWAPPGVAHIDEPMPREGPSGALAFGLARVDAPWVLVVGGDHPLVRPSLLAGLLARGLQGSADAVVPVRDGHDEPLVAWYRRSVGPVARTLVADGERSLRAVLDAVVVDRMPEADWRALDPDGRSFLDVDTPDDLERARQLVPSRGPDA